MLLHGLGVNSGLLHIFVFVRTMVPIFPQYLGKDQVINNKFFFYFLDRQWFHGVELLQFVFVIRFIKSLTIQLLKFYRVYNKMNIFVQLQCAWSKYLGHKTRFASSSLELCIENWSFSHRSIWFLVSFFTKAMI